MAPLSHRRRLALPALVALAWALLGLLVPAGAATTTVAVDATAYAPATVNVHPGDTVTWNVASSLVGSCHSVTSVDGLFDSGPLSSGILCLGGSRTSWPYTFTKAGTYHYFCKFVSGMEGVVVVAAPSPSPSPTPSPRPSATPSPSASPSPSPSPSISASAHPPTTPSAPGSAGGSSLSPGQTGLAAPGSTRGGGGLSGGVVVAIICGFVAIACAGGLIALRRTGAW